MAEDDLDYQTPESVKRSGWDSVFRPFNLYFYFKTMRAIIAATKYIKDGQDFYPDFIRHCSMIVKAVELTGTKVEYSGLENIPDQPAVYIGNHMSTLETLALGHIIGEKGRLSFVIKESLMKYPYFRSILKELNCITLTRTSPIADLKKILKEGPALLEKGTSIVVFPQHTRGIFHPDEFSTIGCKLARRAKVPVVPLALDTRFWGKGKIISDYGPVKRNIPVRFAFGKPMTIEKNEKEVHAKYLEFIGEKLQQWDAYTPDKESHSG